MKKAITPVISVILLIMLVVAITGGAWYWMTNVQGSLQESAGANIEQTSDLSSTSFSIVSVLCSDADDWVNATILNTGSETIASTESWIVTLSSLSGATLGTNISAMGANYADIGDVASGSAQAVQVQGFGGDVISAGESYSVKINVGSSSQTAICTAS